MSNLKNLVSPQEFAELVKKHNKKSKCRDITVYQWMAPQRLIPVKVGTTRFIDITKYDPKDFK